MKISPAESSDDELEDFVETPKIKKLILKGAKKEPEVIPKILIDRSSYNMLLLRQNSTSDAVTPR